MICAAILAFIFITPPAIFNDRPDFMRISSDEAVRQTHDDDGNTVFTVQVDGVTFTANQVVEKAALERLNKWLGSPFKVSRMQPVYDTTGVLVAYSIWIER